MGDDRHENCGCEYIEFIEKVDEYHYKAYCKRCGQEFIINDQEGGKNGK